MRYLLLVLLLLLSGCVVRVSNEASEMRAVALERARTQKTQSVEDAEALIRDIIKKSLESNFVTLDTAFQNNMALHAATPTDGAKFMAQYLLGLQNTTNAEEAKLAELMVIVEGLYVSFLGYEEVIKAYQRELKLSDEAWDQFVKTEAARLAAQAVQEVITELRAAEQRKKEAAAAEAARESELEKLRKEIEELRAVEPEPVPEPVPVPTPTPTPTE
jgi:hypothetical protein